MKFIFICKSISSLFIHPVWTPAQLWIRLYDSFGDQFVCFLLPLILKCQLAEQAFGFGLGDIVRRSTGLTFIMTTEGIAVDVQFRLRLWLDFLLNSLVFLVDVIEA